MGLARREDARGQPMTALAGLLARLESATEGSRELDGLIWRTIEPEGQWWEFGDGWARRDPDDGAYVTSAPYTTSLDAALTLLPRGYAINNMMIWPGCPSTVTVVETREDHDGRFIHHGGDRFWQAGAATAPIAICIVCLRAREPSDDPPAIAEWEGTMGEIVDKDNELSVFDNQGQDTQPSVDRAERNPDDRHPYAFGLFGRRMSFSCGGSSGLCCSVLDTITCMKKKAL
jgi:hypothetical protein